MCAIWKTRKTGGGGGGGGHPARPSSRSDPEKEHDITESYSARIKNPTDWNLK